MDGASGERLSVRGGEGAREAWARYAWGLPEAPARWIDVAERFVVEESAPDPERTCALLLLALDNCGGIEMFLEGSWLDLVAPHVYVHFRGGDIGVTRTHDIVDRFVRWLARSGAIEPWDEARLLYRSDVARTAAGGLMRGATEAHDACVRLPELDEAVIGPFLGDGAPPDCSAGIARATVRLVALLCAARETMLVRFGALDPRALVEELQGAGGAGGVGASSAPARRRIELFVADFLRIAAALYRWLALEGRLSADRAAEIAGALDGFASDAAPR
jgi:hypothetical protein